MQPTLATTNANPQPKSNHASFEELMHDAKVLGEQAGKGKDTQIKFALMLTKAAYHKTLDTNPDKHGVGIDDATMMAQTYVKAQQGAVIFDAKADKSRKLVSNVRKCLKLGSMTSLGRGQPMQAIEELVEYRQKLRKDPAAAKKLDDAFNMLMRYATVQIKSNQLLPDDERNAFAFRVVSDVKTPVEVLEATRRTLIKLTEGKVANCDGLDNSPEVRACISQINARLINIAKGAK